LSPNAACRLPGKTPAEHDAVVSAAWNAPGVHHVVDETDVAF
jgi:osmotically-inducible protein OsmY